MQEAVGVFIYHFLSLFNASCAIIMMVQYAKVLATFHNL